MEFGPFLIPSTRFKRRSAVLPKMEGGGCGGDSCGSARIFVCLEGTSYTNGAGRRGGEVTSPQPWR